MAFFDYKTFGSSMSRPVDVTYVLRRLTPILGNVGWFISGSFANPNFMSCDVNDIDLFFTSEAEFNKADKKIKNAATRNMYSPVANTYTLNGIRLSVQLVSMRFGTITEVFNSFDLNVCRHAITPTGKRISCKSASDVLRIDNVGYNTFRRFFKYAHRMYSEEQSQDLFGKMVKDYAGNDTLVTEVYGNQKITEPLNVILLKTLKNERGGTLGKYSKEQFIEQAPELLI